MDMKDGARVDLMMMGTPTSSLRTVVSLEEKEHGTPIRANSSLNGTYSGKLMEHGDSILATTEGTFHGTSAKLPGKVAGIHWYHQTRYHAAELTAGYYNTQNRDGYLPVAQMLAKRVWY